MEEKTDLRKLFLMYMVPCLLILANIVASKVTLVFGYPISCSIFIYPFTFLCVALITHFYGTKEGLRSIVLALFCQIVFYVLSILVCNLPTDENSLVNANALKVILAPQTFNNLCYPSVKMMIGVLLAFTLAQIFNVYLYDAANYYAMKYFSAFMSILTSLILDALIFVSITKIGTNANTNLFNAIIIQIIARFIFTIIALGIFYLVTYSKKKNIKRTIKKNKVPRIVIEKVSKPKTKTTTKKRTQTKKKKI